MNAEKKETTVTFTAKHPAPHHRHNARTALIRSLLATEEMRLDDAMGGVLLALVHLRNATTTEQSEEMTRKIGLHMHMEDSPVPNDANYYRDTETEWLNRHHEEYPARKEARLLRAQLAEVTSELKETQRAMHEAGHKSAAAMLNPIVRKLT